MKSVLKSALAVFICLAFLAAELRAQTSMSMKTIDASSASISWSASKVLGGGHSGEVDLKSAHITTSDGKLSGGTFTVDMTSLRSTDLKGAMAEKLDGHLKSDDFFGVDEFPTAKLKITNVIESEDGFTFNGDITIKGVTEAVSFDVNNKDGISMAKIVLDRTKFGIRYGSDRFFDNLGDKAISDEFTLNINIQL